jgi:uncharacterized RDD family membrane protein YckC
MAAPLRLAWSQGVQLPAPTTLVVEPSRPAGFWRRAAAQAIDGLAVTVGTGVLLFPIDVAAVAANVPPALAAVLLAASVVGRIALAWLYFAGTESSERQATLGKIALGLAVEDRAGGALGFRRASARLASKLLSAVPFGLGFVLAGFGPRKRALHDLVAGTVVVRRGPASAAGIGVAVAVAAVLLALALPNLHEARSRGRPAEAAAVEPRAR